MKKKDIQRSKFIIGCVFLAAMIILFTTIGGNETESISNGQCIRTGIKALALMGFALLSNYLLNKEVKKYDIQRNLSSSHADRNHARRSNK